MRGFVTDSLTFGGLALMICSLTYWCPVLGAFTAGLAMLGIGLLGARKG